MIHARNDYQRIQDPEGKIPQDEPVFLLRAQDETAAETVKFWIRQNKKKLKEAAKSGLPAVEFQKRKKGIVLAEAHCYRMEEWTPQKPADV